MTHSTKSHRPYGVFAAFAAGVCACLVLGSSSSSQSGESTQRFELVQLGAARRDQFLLDSQLGHVFRSMEVDADGTTAWIQEVVITHQMREALQRAAQEKKDQP